MKGKTSSAEEQARGCILDVCVQTAKSWGCSDAAGFLRGFLLLSSEPMSMDELVEKTGYSKSTVSTSMGVLEGQGMVHRVIKPGDKRYYYVSENSCNMIFKTQTANLWQTSQTFLNAAEQAKKTLLDAGYDESKGDLIGRLDLIEENCKKLQRLTELARKFTVDDMIEVLEREEKSNLSGKEGRSA